MAKSLKDELDEFERAEDIADLKREMDQFEEDFDEDEGIKDAIAFDDDQSKPMTKEDRQLGGLYQGMKNLSVLGKPAAYMATPILESVRSIPKYIAKNFGEDTSQTPDIRINAEHESFYPSDRATLTNLLTDIANATGVKTSNLKTFKSDDYPKAAQFASNMTNPYNLAGAVADLFVANKIPSINTKIAKNMAKVETPYKGLVEQNTGVRNIRGYRDGKFIDPELRALPNELFIMPKVDREKMALNFLRSKSKDKQLLQKVEDAGNINDVASMMANDPDNYIRPFSSDKTLDFIDGPITTTKEAGSAVTSSSRDLSKGKIGKMLEEQNIAIENTPGTHNVPKAELIAAVKAHLRGKRDNIPTGEYDLIDIPYEPATATRPEVPASTQRIPRMKEAPSPGGLLPTQITAAEKMIDDIINLMQPSSNKIKLIKKVEDANTDIIRISKEIADEVSSKVLELGEGKKGQLNRLIDKKTGDMIPDNIPNPEYREGLQWKAGLDVIDDPTGQNIFPKTRNEYVTKVTDPNVEYTPVKPVTEQATGTTQRYEQSGKVVSEPGRTNYVDSVDEINNPASPLNSVKSQDLLDIAQGKQNAPARIPNPQYQAIMEDIGQKLNAIDLEIAELTNGKVPAGKKYSSLYKLKKKKAALEEFYYSNLDDSAIDMNQYMDFIDKQNLKPIGYASDMRRQGNALQSAVGTETAQEAGASQAAGKALEYGGKKAQEQAMGQAPGYEQDLFNIRNREIHANITARDLMNGQRISPQNKLNVPVMDMARGVARQAIDLYPEYIAPYTSKMKEGMGRAATQGSRVAKYNLPMQLIEYQIPRDSNKIIDNKDIVLAKIAQMSNDPQLVKTFQDAVNKNPEKLRKVLPALVLQFPDLFEDDDYNRIDGMILDPIMKQKALKDIRNSQKYNTREKAALSKRLEMEGILED